MGRPKSATEPRNWGLSVKLQKSVGKHLDAIAKKLGWSRASVVTELIEKFGDNLLDDERKKED